MHRHGYQGRKLSRKRDQRRALLKAQATSLVLYESIVTTQAKAKELAPFFERLVTYAKKGDLANQRRLRAYLSAETAVKKMLQELAPAFSDRQGGYTRVVGAGLRRGDSAQMAVISLVLPEKMTQPEKTEKASELAPESKDKKAEAQTAAKPKAKTAPKKKAAAKGTK